MADSMEFVAYKLMWDPHQPGINTFSVRIVGPPNEVPPALTQLLAGLHATGHEEAAVYREQEWVKV